MNRAQILKIVNIFLFVLFITQAGSGLLHSQIPPAVYEDIHEKGGFVFIALVLAHMYLNWAWIRRTYERHRINNSQASKQSR